MRRFVVLSLCCLLVLGARGQEEGEEGTGGGATAEVSDCARSLEVIEQKIEAVFSEEYNVTINCISFDNVGAVISAVASGFSNTGSIRYNIECRSGVLVAEQSTMNASRISNTGCLMCQDSDTDICITPCAEVCERCYNSNATCSRCSHCNADEYEMCEPPKLVTSEYCGASCDGPGLAEANGDLFNFCECRDYRLLDDYPRASLEVTEVDEKAPCEQDLCEGEPVALEHFSCMPTCPTVVNGVPNYRQNEETRVCFACGLEFCVECESNVCTRCLAETFLFENECFACPLNTVAQCAFEQEEEVEEEERANTRRSIELAISLPIVCALVIVFFVGMSFIAHHRYPHISIHGHKRHRKPQAPVEEELEESEPGSDEPGTSRGRTTRGRTTRGRTTRGRTTKTRSDSSTTSPLPDEQQQQHVWRARPTVHFR